MKQMDELGLINIPSYHIVAPFLASSASVNEQFKKNKAVSTWYGFAEKTNNPEVLNFIERYKKAYGSSPTPDAVYSYDSVMLLYEALKSGAKTSEEVSEYLHVINNYQGIANVIDFDENGRINDKPYLIKSVISGEFIELE